MLALLENRGRFEVEMLSVSEGRSSVDARIPKSGLGSPRYLLNRGCSSNETCSASGEEIKELVAVRPSVDEA